MLYGLRVTNTPSDFKRPIHKCKIYTFWNSICVFRNKSFSYSENIFKDSVELTILKQRKLFHIIRICLGRRKRTILQLTNLSFESNDMSRLGVTYKTLLHVINCTHER